MQGQKDKIRLIFTRFLLVAIGYIVAYSFLHWFLLIKLELFSLKEDVVNLWIPLVLAFVVAIIWLRPGAKLVKYKTENGWFSFLFLAGAAMMTPTIIAQEYLQAATGKLTALENIEQFTEKAPTRYYSLQHYFIDKSHAGIENHSTISGKRNQNLNYYFYIAAPIFNNGADTTSRSATYWLCKRYSKTISNKLSKEEKDEQYRLLKKEVTSDFYGTSFENFTYLERTGNTNDHEKFNQTIEYSGLVSSNPVIFTAQTGVFANRTGNKLFWIFASLAIGSAVIFIVFILLKA
jgi:rhomboid protease GluP